MKPARVLLACGVDALVASGQVNLKRVDNFCVERGRVADFVYPDGANGTACARPSGFGELEITVVYGAKNSKVADHFDHRGTEVDLITLAGAAPDSNKNRQRLGIGGVAKGWVERKTGCYIMGPDSDNSLSSFSKEAANNVTRFADEVVSRPREFQLSGRFIF